MTDLDHRALDAAAELVLRQIGEPPTVGLVLGSGLGAFAERLSHPVSLPSGEIPAMPVSRVPGHAGRLVVGGLAGARVACLQGRVHLYEGHGAERVVFGARLLERIGCRVVVLTNAAGGVSPALTPGSLMLITDHLNLTGHNPLVGWYEDTPRFVDLSNAYDAELCAEARAASVDVGVVLAEGIYAGLLGPSYETKAEVRSLGRLGADAVGMSTVLETIALVDAGARVCAISCITNAAAGVPGAVLDHEHVQSVAAGARDHLARLVERLVERLVAQLGESPKVD